MGTSINFDQGTLLKFLSTIVSIGDAKQLEHVTYNYGILGNIMFIIDCEDHTRERMTGIKSLIVLGKPEKCGEGRYM